MKYVITSEIIDFLFETKDYINVLCAFKEYNIISGRTELNQPTFSFAGISFTMLNKEDLEKYKVLK